MADARALDTVVRGGIVVRGDGRLRCDVGIVGGTIAVLATPDTLPQATREIDATGCYVVPGLVDSHFHCRAPGRPDREDFDSGTKAAAAGGVTTLFEMPIAEPPPTTPETLEARMRLAEAQARIDVGFYLAPGDVRSPRVDETARRGAVAAKIVLHDPPPGRESAFDGLSITGNGDLLQALEHVRDAGLVCAIHAEDQELIDHFEAVQRAAGGKAPIHHARSRPAVAEALAVARIGAINEHVGAPVHIVHVSSGLAVEYIRWFRARGQDMTAETTPAYLFASEAEVREFGPFVKINPPLRTDEDRRALWAALEDGTLDMVVSDHAPFLPDEKEAGWEDIWDVGSGIPGVELTGRFLWHEAFEGRVPLERVVAWCSEGPARRFGLAPHKGSIEVGADADLVVLDPRGAFVAEPDKLHSRSAGSLRHVFGRRFRGDIRLVLARGRTAFEQGVVKARPGDGGILTHARADAASASERSTA
jgi:allantoinase